MSPLRLRPSAWVGLAVALLAASASSPARADFLGPTPYLSFADSPFNGGAFGAFYLEDFEDGALNTPGATASAGWSVLGPGVFTDSVDADDGTIDGSGAAGHSFFSAGTQSSLTITFDAAALGGSLPTVAGIVWTDVGSVGSGTTGFGPVLFSATGPGGIPLGSIGPFTLGDGSAAGGTAEDRFFGVTSAAGISSITISMSNSVDWEVDHLQYGIRPVPEPGSLALVAIGGAATLALARRRSRRRGAAPSA